MNATLEQLGIGIYTPAEAAFYARVPTKLMNRWIFGDSSGKPVIERQLADSDEKVVTFLDLVQALAIREIRHRYRLPLQRIRQGVDEARSRYDIAYPLAREHCIYLFSDQKNQGHGHIIIKIKGDEDDVEDRYVQLTGQARGNYLIKQVVEMFLNNLSFDPETKLASKYRPMSNDKAEVSLDPHRRFGEPVIDPGGYTAEALWNATNAEGSLVGAAEAFGVLLEEVELANSYYNSLLTATVS